MGVVVDKILGDVLMHDHSEADLGAILDSRYVNVTGDTMTGALVITPSANGTSIFNVTNQAGTSVFNVDTTNQRVGIGTTSPAEQLHLVSATNSRIRMQSGTSSQSVLQWYAGTNLAWEFYANNTGTGTANLGFYQNSTGLTKIQLAATGAVNIGYIAGTGYAFNVQPSGNIDMVAGGGNVGIGTTIPGGTLHINGTADGQQLIVEAHSTQTNNIVEIHDSSSNVLAYISPTGGALFKDKVIFTQTDGNEFIDSLTDGYMDYRATTAHRFGDGTNQLVIDADGDLSLEGTAKYERHVQIPAMLDGKVANQPTSEDFFTAGGLQFASAGAQYAYCQWEIPDDWDGTDVVFEIDWFPDSGAISGTDAIRWTVEYRSIAEGEAINLGTSVTADNGVGGDTTDYARYETKHTRFTLDFDNANQPLTKQDHIYFKISRDTSVANDFAGTITVSAYEIIYNSTGFPTSN